MDVDRNHGRQQDAEGWAAHAPRVPCARHPPAYGDRGHAPLIIAAHGHREGGGVMSIQRGRPRGGDAAMERGPMMVPAAGGGELAVAGQGHGRGPGAGGRRPPAYQGMRRAWDIGGIGGACPSNLPGRHDLDTSSSATWNASGIGGGYGCDRSRVRTVPHGLHPAMENGEDDPYLGLRGGLHPGHDGRPDETHAAFPHHRLFACGHLFGDLRGDPGLHSEAR